VPGGVRTRQQAVSDETSAANPYGDTVQHLTSDTEVAMLDELDRLADLATERVHRYPWFVGA
jgi:hypothetical protein